MRPTFASHRVGGLTLLATVEASDAVNCVRPCIELATSAPGLPELTPTEKLQLVAGVRVQRQTRDRNCGSGFVVQDIQASPAAVMSKLASFDRYSELIPTVRRVEMGETTPTRTKATFVLSKFCIKADVVQRVDLEANTLEFTLDTVRRRPMRSMVLKEACGYWFIEEPPERPGYSRVWLSATLTVSRAVPNWLIDYASNRALPRATTWLKPCVEGDL